MGSNILQMLKSLKSRVEIFEGGNGKTFFSISLECKARKYHLSNTKKSIQLLPVCAKFSSHHFNSNDAIDPYVIRIILNKKKSGRHAKQTRLITTMRYIEKAKKK